MQDDKIVSEAVAHLASVFGEELSGETLVGEESDAFWKASQRVAKATGIVLTKPAIKPQTISIRDYLNLIARNSRFRVRQVVLQGQWWQQDNGPLLAFDRTTYAPIALILDNKGRYQQVDSLTEQATLVTAERANNLALQAFSFYRTLPDAALSLKSLLQFAITQQKPDLIRLLMLQIFIGLLGLFVPIATGVILDTAVPNASMSLLMQFIFGLLATVFAGAAFSAAQALTLIRLRFKTNVATEAAVWDRLLRLPINFFREYSPGDLAMRSGGIDFIQQEITGAVIQSILGGIFSFLTLALMFYYAPVLALTAMVVLAIFVLLIWFNARIQLRFQRPIAELQGKLAALTLQFLNSISKLRVTGSEPRAFALWAKQFATKNRLFFQANIWSIRFTLVRSIFSILILIGLYAMVGSKITSISFGKFIAFNAAFGQFFAAVLSLAGVLTVSMRLIPLYERIKPILQTQPELEKDGLDPGMLTGHIEIKQVSFRYQLESPLVLNKISITINPGEFVAFVGPTGSGKSTLFRLLLGFEKPTAGTIFYNGQDLAKLNLQSLREQLGVVLQNGTLLPGTLFDNIVGAHPYTIEQAWEAVKQVDLAKDIDAMPMGMHTLVTEGGKTLSAGQRQRLMIARALIHKPRILLLDEATSALDNPTQMEVMQHLERLKLTRIIIAHRESTIINADKVYVLSQEKMKLHGQK